MLQSQSSMVSVPRANGKGTMESFFVKPEGSGPFPGLVVIHEAFGLNDNIRGIARQFAEQGYAALAVDLSGEAVRPAAGGVALAAMVRRVTCRAGGGRVAIGSSGKLVGYGGGLPLKKRLLAL